MSVSAYHLDQSADLRRLVLLANYGGPYAGTFVSMIRAIAREASERGWRVEVILSLSAQNSPWLTELSSDDIPYRFAPDASAVSLGCWLLGTVVTGNERTVLHSHFTRFDVPAAIVSIMRRNVSVFWHIHSYVLPQWNIRVRNVLKYALVGRLTKRIFCVAPDIAGAVRKRGGGQKRVAYVPNAIDTGRFPLTTADERLKARRMLGLPHADRIVLHFGWDWERKGGDLFVQTMEKMAKAGAPVLGVTVGGGDIARAEIAKRGAHNVRVIESRNDVLTLYAAADVFFSPSVAEGMPFAIAEALSTGLAVVGSDIPGQAVIGRGIDSCQLTARDADDFAAAIRSMLARDREMITSQAQAGRLEIIRRCDLEPWAVRMVDFYEQSDR